MPDDLSAALDDIRERAQPGAYRTSRARTSVPGPYSIGSDLWPGLSRLAEEAGEVIQVIGKLIGTHGETGHFDGTDLRDRLTAELGDLEAAVAFVVDRNDLDWNLVNERRALKRDVYEQWHQEGQRALLGSGGTDG